MSKRKKENNNLKLAVSFGFLVFFIILISLVFKTFDLIKKSKFDGNNRFTVAILGEKSAELVSVSPKEGSLTNLHVEGVSDFSDLEKFWLPIDATAKISSPLPSNPKSYFTKLLFYLGKEETNLTVIDLVRLSFYSAGVEDKKIFQESVMLANEKEISRLSSSLFVDPQVLNEKVSIVITNSTDVSGLGNKLAKYIGNMGGNVILINSSQNTDNNSKIFYKRQSYTQRKISKILGVESEKKETGFISDLIIIIGEDKKDLINL